MLGLNTLAFVITYVVSRIHLRPPSLFCVISCDGIYILFILFQDYWNKIQGLSSCLDREIWI